MSRPFAWLPESSQGASSATARNFARRPPKSREDLRNGDVHLHRGDHPYYGPDAYAFRRSEREKPGLETHGFYLAEEDGPDYDEPVGFWAKLKAQVIGDHRP